MAEAILENQEQIYEALEALRPPTFTQEELDDPDKTIRRYNEILENDPANKKAVNNICLMFCKQKKYEEAISICLRALKFQPDNAHFHFIAGNVYKRHEQYKPASLHLVRAINLNENNDLVSGSAGLCCYFIGDYQNATTMLQKAVELNQKYGHSENETWLHGMLKLCRGQYREAEQIFTKCIDLKPDPFSYCGRGEARDKLGDLDGADADFKQARKLDQRFNKITAGKALAALPASDREFIFKELRASISANSNFYHIEDWQE